MNTIGFLGVPEHTPEAQQLFDEDIVELGYVMNNSRLWAYQPATIHGIFDLLRATREATGLTYRQCGILITACASALGDSYCSVAWGSKLADHAGAGVASAVLRGDDVGLNDSERALAGWARKVTRDPNHTSPADVQELRDAGFTDGQIFGITVFVALRIAFSTVNDALGSLPDAAYRDTAPEAVLDAVTFGRPFDGEPALLGGEPAG